MRLLVKNISFALLFFDGVLLNIIHIFIYFGYVDLLGDFALNALMSLLFLSFWLTGLIPICYTIGILIDKQTKGSKHE